MSNKLSKKYIGSDQVGSVQLELENNSSIRSKDSLGVSQDLLKLDASDELILLKQPFLPGDASSALQAIPKQQLDSEISVLSGDISDLQTDVSTLQGEVSTLQSEMDVVQEQNSVVQAIAYNSFASVYADGQPGILDPKSSTNPRPGWYYQNTVAGQKINWYFFDGVNQASIQLQDFSCYAIMSFDSVSPLKAPILAIYTFPTGTGDARPGFAHSVVVYSAPMSITPVVGKQYLVYCGQNPVAHPELPRIELSYVAASSAGDQSPTEIVLTSSFGSDSSAGVDTVQYMVESLGVSSPSFRGEVDLEIRPAFRELDGSVNMLSAKISNLADPTLDQDAVTKAFLDSSISPLSADISTLQTDVSTLQGEMAAIESFDYAQTKYVAKSGNDSTGDGSQHNPFLTISAALSSITDASASNRYAILVQAGNYTEASLSLKANVFIIGNGQKEDVRISGAVSMNADFSGSADNRSGFSMVTLLSDCDFNWQTVTSAAGKLYFNEVVFASTVNMYGHNNAIAQSQFNSCIIFSTLTISGINVGVFTNNVCYGNIVLNQHPNGGMATILAATGGYCGNITATTTVSDFSRRVSLFLRSFPSENLTVDGPSSYADYTIDSGSKNGAVPLNGGNLMPMNFILSQTIRPNAANIHNVGDWSKQYFFNFSYVHASSGTDLYLTSVMENYDPAGDSTGRGIFIQSDGYGLQSDVNGGNIELETAAVSGTGIRGKIALKSRIVEVESQLDMQANKIVDLADPTDAQDAATKAYVDSQIASGTDFEVQKIVLSATDISNQYIDLDFKASLGSVIASSDRVNLIIVLGADSDADFQQDNSGAVTRLSFQGPSAAAGESPLAEGQIIYFNYVKA